MKGRNKQFLSHLITWEISVCIVLQDPRTADQMKPIVQNTQTKIFFFTVMHSSLRKNWLLTASFEKIIKIWFEAYILHWNSHKEPNLQSDLPEIAHLTSILS